MSTCCRRGFAGSNHDFVLIKKTVHYEKCGSNLKKTPLYMDLRNSNSNNHLEVI